MEKRGACNLVTNTNPHASHRSPSAGEVDADPSGQKSKIGKKKKRKKQNKKRSRKAKRGIPGLEFQYSEPPGKRIPCRVQRRCHAGQVNHSSKVVRHLEAMRAKARLDLVRQGPFLQVSLEVIVAISAYFVERWRARRARRPSSRRRRPAFPAGSC